MPKVGGRRKKARTHKETTENEETSTGQKIPKTFIIKRGDIPNPLKSIIGDMREVMYPHTAMKLRESSKNRLKDYIQMSSGFGVTHMLLFSATSSSNYLRLVKLPDGPTITFKILSYSSHKDILSTQKKPKIFGRTLAAPLLILNGFNQTPQGNEDVKSPNQNHYNLVYLMMQKMFPQLDLAKAKIHNTKKTVLFNLDHERDVIEFRYYGLRVSHTGINKNIKQLLEAKTAPNLKGFSDISQYILRENDYMSENEVEDELEDDTKSKGGDKQGNKMTVKLSEIGPRLTLKLIKIEEGLLRGNVIYHRLVQKTPEEIENNRKKLKQKLKQKEEMKQKQQEIVNEKMSKKLKKQELKRKKEFLEEQKGEEEDEEDDGEEYDKENEDAPTKQTKNEIKSNLKKRPFDFTKDTVNSDGEELEEEDEEDEVDPDDEVEDLGENDEEEYADDDMPAEFEEYD